MKLKLIAPARKPEWGEEFWEMRTFARMLGKKASGPTLALPTLAALTPSDAEVVITDENVEPIDFDESVDLVGITFLTPLAPRAYEIADEFRRREIKVILGGIHASMLPEEAVQHADSVLIGEAEGIWSQVIADFRKGAAQKFYQADKFPELEKLVIPRWDLLKSEKYCYLPVQVGRGCPYNCDFCSVTAFNGRRYRHKKLENVIAEIEYLSQIDKRGQIFFVDDNLTAVLTFSKQLFKKLIPYKIRWWCQSSINNLDDDNLLNLMYETGCRMIFVGLESVSQESLNSMNKGKVNKVVKFKKIIEKVYSHGIAVFGSFILGNDTDEETIFDDTIRFIKESSIPFPMINICTAFPGTKLREKLEQENRMLSKDWWEYNAESVCIIPKKMSPDTLQKGRNYVYRQIYSYKSLFDRLNSLWNKEVLVRKSKRGMANAFLINFKFLLKVGIRRWRFAIRGLWHPKCSSIMSLLLGINFHEYIYSRGQKDENGINKKNIGNRR